MMIMAQHPHPQQQSEHGADQLNDGKAVKEVMAIADQSTSKTLKTKIGNQARMVKVNTPSNNGISSLSSKQQSTLEVKNCQQQQHQQLSAQEGKRTLIKNQLYLIEQLQLENANLRNERDQLQLENEELKFQLQMISSSNILNQPGAPFNDPQLEKLVASSTSSGTTSGCSSEIDHSHTNHQAKAIHCGSSSATTSANSTTTSSASTSEQTTILARSHFAAAKFPACATPMTHATTTIGDNQQNTFLSSVSPIMATMKHSTPVRCATSVSTGAGQVIVETQFQSASGIGAAASDVLAHRSPSGNCEKVSNDGSHLTGYNMRTIDFGCPERASINCADFPNSLPLTSEDDDENLQMKLVEQRYGDGERVHAAAIVIQRAFRKYQICKRFRTITEQLRHACQSNSSSSTATASNATGHGTRQRRDTADIEATSSTTPGSKTPTPKCSPSHEPSVPFASGTTRAAAWESLSYAASRLAASAAAATASTKQALVNGVNKSVSNQQVVQQSASIVTNQEQNQRTASSVVAGTVNNFHQQRLQSVEHPSAVKSDTVVAAAINFQQLESLRKRQYRVGLNVFNKNPEKGVSYLIAHSFIDSAQPYAKSSMSFYLSNQMHFMNEKQQQQQMLSHHHHLHNKQRYQNHQFQPQHDPQLQARQMYLNNCQLCYEEDNLKRNVAYFLLHRKGLAKEKIGQYLGNLQCQFNQDVLKYYLQDLDFTGLQIDVALRKFSATLRLPGEAQKIERFVDCFAQRYVQCQQINHPKHQHQQQQPQTPLLTAKNQQQQQNNQTSTRQSSQNVNVNNNNQQQNLSNYKQNLTLLSKDEIFILTFAIIMLNTDLHSPSLKPTSRMSPTQFVNNLRGVFKSHTITQSDLIEIYERVKANQIATTPDHVTHVMKVQQGLTVSNGFQRKELPNLCVPHRRLVCFCRLFEVYDVNKKERLGQHQREIFLFNDLLLVTKLARRARANSIQQYSYRQSIPLQGLYVQLFQTTHYNFGIRLCQRSNDETLIMFNARNELDQSRFVDDLSESIAEMDEMDSIRAHNIIETIHLKHQERLRLHAMMHQGALSGSITQQGCAVSEKSDCDIRKQQSNENYQQQQQQPPPIMMIGGHKDRQEEEPNKCTPSTTFSSSSCTTQTQQQQQQRRAKFHSNPNLSNSMEATEKENIPSTSTDSDTIRKQPKSGLRYNRSFVQQPSRQMIFQQTRQQAAGPSAGASDQTPVDNMSGTHRSCSIGSVHSLDSGLFLSRDVSPNQSS